jgi:hypothetical protein
MEKKTVLYKFNSRKFWALFLLVALALCFIQILSGSVPLTWLGFFSAYLWALFLLAIIWSILNSSYEVIE